MMLLLLLWSSSSESNAESNAEPPPAVLQSFLTRWGIRSFFVMLKPRSRVSERPRTR